ncbi:MAG: hypothetical protein P1V35_02110 [Planctomycetota bacterium]|nr:hypothetical protein [Planctomycetota bacterium]
MSPSCTVSLRLLLLLLLLPLALVLGPPAQAAQRVKVGCKRCKNLGVLPCSEHKKEILELEKDVLFCSVAAECEPCGGSFLMDCDRCEHGTSSDAVAERRKEVADWLAAETMRQHMGRPVAHVETKHFLLILDTGPLRQGKKRIDSHTCLHRVAQDVEQVATLLGEHLELGGKGPAQKIAEGPSLEGQVAESEYFSKMRMWFWESRKDHRGVMSEFLHSGSSGDFKMLGRNPVFSLAKEANFSTLPQVRRVFTHNAAHMLISNLYKELWFGDTTGGWYDAGAAHWYEYKIHGLTTNYCIEEGTVMRDYHGGQWRAAIRKRLAKEDGPFLPQLINQDTGQMELPEQALCWSFYDWIVANHPQTLKPMLLALKQEIPSRTILKENLGQSLVKIEEDWRAWVAVTYPTKVDKPRKPKPEKKPRR